MAPVGQYAIQLPWQCKNCWYDTLNIHSVSWLLHNAVVVEVKRWSAACVIRLSILAFLYVVTVAAYM
jgi:hypothetical protein